MRSVSPLASAPSKSSEASATHEALVLSRAASSGRGMVGVVQMWYSSSRMNALVSASAAASSSASNAAAQARPVVTLLNGGSSSLTFSPDADGTIDHEAQVVCSYCRAFVNANQLASHAHNPEFAVVTCFSCIEKKRAANAKYSSSPKGRLSIRKSRRSHRAAQRSEENERRREERRVRSGRPTEAEAAAAWAQRLVGLFGDSDNSASGAEEEET